MPHLRIVENIVDRVRQGYKLVTVPVVDDHPDALPEFARTLRSELQNTFPIARFTHRAEATRIQGPPTDGQSVF